jgi:hypothetical protein
MMNLFRINYLKHRKATELKNKIQKAKKEDDLRKLDDVVYDAYKNGLLNKAEYSDLDAMIGKKLGESKIHDDKTTKEEDMKIQESVANELFEEKVTVSDSRSITSAYMSMFEAKDEVDEEPEEDDQTDVDVEKDVKEEAEMDDKEEVEEGKKSDASDEDKAGGKKYPKPTKKDKDEDMDEAKVEIEIDDEDEDEEEVEESLTVESAYHSMINTSITEAKSDFKTFIAKNASITGKGKDDVDELEAVKKLMKAKNMDQIKKIVIGDFHVSEQEFQKMQSDYIIASL